MQKVRRGGRQKGQKPRYWEGADLDFLKATYMFFSDEQLGKILGRSRKTIHGIRKKHGLMKKEASTKLKSTVSNTPVIFILPKEFANKREKLLDLVNEIS